MPVQITFIVLYLAFAWIWTCPERSILRGLRDRMTVAVVRVGLWHSWNVFLPNPPRSDVRLEGRVVTDRGEDLELLPDLGEMSNLRAFAAMRHRKLKGNLCMDRNRWYRRPFSRYLGTRAGGDASVLVRVDLVMEERAVDPPVLSTMSSSERTRSARRGMDRYLIHRESFESSA